MLVCNCMRATEIHSYDKLSTINPLKKVSVVTTETKLDTPLQKTTCVPSSE